MINRIAIFLGTIILAVGVLLFGRDWYIKTVQDILEEI